MRPGTCIVFIIIALMSCKKSRMIKDEYITLAYKQTFCADAWATGSNDSLTLGSLTAYLNSSGLYVAGINIKQDTNPDLCNACICKTGKTISVSTLNTDSLKAKYGRIGFK